MRFHSTPESADNLEITKLAIIETVLSIAIYVCLGLYLGTFKYLALAVVFAPLMLFRTKGSVEWGIDVFGEWDKKMDTLNVWLGRLYDQHRSLFAGLLLSITGILFLVFAITATPLVGIIIRITATVYWGVRRPLSMLKEAPGNWLRQSFCTDFFHPPEIVPLETLIWGNDPKRITFIRVINNIRYTHGLVPRLFKSLVFSPLFIIGFLPMLTYRITFKATSIAYLPFIWIAHMTLSSDLSVKIRLERFTKGELEKTRRAVSWAIFAALVGKLLFVYGWLEPARFENMFPSKRFIESIVNPNGWPWWQITLVVEATLTFILFFFADIALPRIEPKQVWGEGIVLNTLSTTSFLRASLGIVTISYFFYVALKIAYPGLVSRLFGA